MSYWQRLNTRALLTKLGYSPIYVLISDALWLIWANPPLTIGERSERGQVTASAGMEGGEDLELSPSQKTSIRYQFEVFCKRQPGSGLRNRVFLSRSRKRICELTSCDCDDAQTFEYRGRQLWNGF